MDVARHRVFADGRDVTLTHMEFELLRYLLINRGIALTRERLLDAVWGVDYPGDTRTVDVHMRTLRVKLGQASRYLQTVRGVGYRLEDVDAETNLSRCAAANTGYSAGDRPVVGSSVLPPLR